MCTFITKCTLKNRVIADGDMFTFTICSYFHCIGIVVPLYSHTTKSTPIPSYHQKSRSLYSTHLFGQNLTIPYPNSHSISHQEPQQNKPIPHHLSSTLSNYPYLIQTLIISTQINKISHKIPHSHSTPTSNHIPSTSKNKSQQNSTQTPNNTIYT